MDKKHHNFEINVQMPLKPWKWLVDAYNNKMGGGGNLKGEAIP